jgi:hypothetical protein
MPGNQEHYSGAASERSCEGQRNQLTRSAFIC